MYAIMGKRTDNQHVLILTLVTLILCSDNLEVNAQKKSDDSNAKKNASLVTPVDSQTTFSPSVSATCRTGIMTIKVETKHPFAGVVHSRDYRKPECSGFGEFSKVTELHINMLAEKGDRDYCGIFQAQPTAEERSIAIAVRTHRTLELAGDKFYMITCGKAGFQNTRNETSLVNLQLMRNGRKVDRVIYGMEYVLRADISRNDGQFGMKVKRCFSFSDTNNTVQLVDHRGCSDTSIISPFEYDHKKGMAEARIFSMFKFPESNRVHFQCDILVCRDRCPSSLCNLDFGSANRNGSDSSKSGRSLGSTDDSDLAIDKPSSDGAMLASYSVFVLEPGAPLDEEDRALSQTSLAGSPPAWVLYLCIVFGVLFLIMLIVNVLLCSAMTCSCAKTEIISSDKEQSMIEEFDPYNKSWHGSQYGSRYSLSGGIKPIPPPLISVDTSNSISSSSDYGNNVVSTNGINIFSSASANPNSIPAVYGSTSAHAHSSRPSSRYSNRSHRHSRNHRSNKYISS